MFEGPGVFECVPESELIFFNSTRRLLRFWGHLSSLKYAKKHHRILGHDISLQLLWYLWYLGCWKFLWCRNSAEFWDRATTVFGQPTFSGRSRNSPTQLCRRCATGLNRPFAPPWTQKIRQRREGQLLVGSGTTTLHYTIHSYCAIQSFHDICGYHYLSISFYLIVKDYCWFGSGLMCKMPKYVVWNAVDMIGRFTSPSSCIAYQLHISVFVQQ